MWAHVYVGNIGAEGQEDHVDPLSSPVFGNREVDAVEKQGSCLPLKEDNSIRMTAAS